MFTLYGGKLADRYDKRILLMASNAIWTAMAVAMGILIISGGVTLGAIYVFAVLLGLVNAVETPVRQAFVSELVGSKLLPNAISLNAAAFNLARIVGPAVAGVAVAVLHVGPVFLLNGVSYLAPIAGLWLMRPGRPVPRRAAAGEGHARAAHHRRAAVRVPAPRPGAADRPGAGHRAARLQLPAHPRARGQDGVPHRGGAVRAAHHGAGRRGARRRAGEHPAAVAAHHRHRPRRGGDLRLLEAAVGLAPTFVTMVVLLVPTGFFMVFFAQAANQRVQLGTDPALRGRVMSLYVMVFLGTTPVGALVVGWLSSQFGPRPTVWVGGLACVAAAAGAFAIRCWRQDLRVHVHLKPVRLHLGAPRAATVCVPGARPRGALTAGPVRGRCRRGVAR